MKEELSFEDWCRECLAPAIPYIPRWIHPNAITFVSMVVICVAGVFGMVAQDLSPWEAVLARVAVSVAIFLYAVLDLMDGQHARHSGQTSKLGEMLDHCTDALGVPLCSFVCSWTICHDHVARYCLAIGSLLTYYLQLIVYHKTGEFILAPNDGAKAQLSCCAAILGAAVVLYYVPRDHVVLFSVVLLINVTAVFQIIPNNLSYLVRLGGDSWKGLAGFLPCVAVAVVSIAQSDPINFWSGNKVGLAVDGSTFLAGLTGDVMICLISFRCSSLWVFHVMYKRPFSGFDAVVCGHCLGFVVAAATTHLLPPGLVAWLPWYPVLAGAHMLACTVRDASFTLNALAKQQ